jgi:hypothetical protein
MTLALHRLPDWEARLTDYLEPLRERPHVYGRHDCALFAAGAVQAMTGVDPIPELRGRYSTARGSIYALRKYGAGSLADTLTAKFGEPVHPAHAKRGDLVMDEKAVGVAMGDYAIFVARDGERVGLMQVLREEWTNAWRVPFEARQ